jgi:streptogramin lyase
LSALGRSPPADGDEWFAEDNANQIGRITSTGCANLGPLRAPTSLRYGIAAGPDGSVGGSPSSPPGR